MRKLGLALVFLDKIESHRVDAVAEPAWGRTIVEDMAQVGVAATAQHLGAHHTVAGIGLDGHALLVHRGPETRPAATGVKLRFRAEQPLATAGTGVDARHLSIRVLARVRRLGPLLARDMVLLRRELRPPLRIRLDDLLSHSSLCCPLIPKA